MIVRPGERVGSVGMKEEDAADLVGVADALERDLDLEQGTVIRELTALLHRRRRFEELKRAHGVCLQVGTSTWAD